MTASVVQDIEAVPDLDVGRVFSASRVTRRMQLSGECWENNIREVASTRRLPS